MRAPYLILDRGPCPRKSRELEVGLRGPAMAGFFTVELIHAATGLIKQRLEFPNVITNAGLNAWLTVGGSNLNALLSWAAVGTGAAAPAVTDTALGAQVGGRVNATGGVADATGGVSTAPEYSFFRRTREWGAAEGNGNLTEIGFFTASTGGTMWCRALFRDSGNNPVTVTKTSADILRVTYEVRAYPPAGDSAYSVTISGTSYSVTARPTGLLTSPTTGWGINASTIGALPVNGARLSTQSALGARLTNVAQNTVLSPSSQSATWDGATLVRSLTATWEPAAGAITAPSWFPGAMSDGSNNPALAYQVLFAPALVKTTLNRLILNYTFQWSRVTP